jgi:hypothetical protein
MKPNRWARPGTIEIFVDRVECPHRRGAGNLWDVDRFWVQVALEGQGAAETQVFSARPQSDCGPEGAEVTEGIVGERLVLPLPEDEAVENSFRASLFDADVVCRMSSEVGSCKVPLMRRRSSLLWRYELTDWSGASVGFLYLTVSMPEFPQMANKQPCSESFSDSDVGYSFEDLWIPLLQMFSCHESCCEASNSKEKLVIVRNTYARGRDDPKRPFDLTRRSVEGQLGPMDSGGAALTSGAM